MNMLNKKDRGKQNTARNKQIPTLLLEIKLPEMMLDIQNLARHA